MRKLGELTVPDIGTPEEPLTNGWQYYYRKDGFCYYRNAPYGEDTGGWLSSATGYIRVTDPRFQDEIDARLEGLS